MFRPVLAVMSFLVLAGCQTMPEWAQNLGETSQPAAQGQPAAAAAASYQPPPDQELLELERRLAATAQTRGLAEALTPALDPIDGFVIRPGAIYQGQENVPAALGASASGGPLFWQADRVFVSDGGDMGMTSGRYVQVVEGAEAVQGRYLVVWRRDSAGEWKALAETRIPDPAPAPPARRR
jgi:ketosteroid isomerase-like protein